MLDTFDDLKLDDVIKNYFGEMKPTVDHDCCASVRTKSHGLILLDLQQPHVIRHKGVIYC